MEIEIISRHQHYDNAKRYALLRIFVEKDLRPGKEDHNMPDNVLEHLIWRHQVDLRDIAHDKDFRMQVADYLGGKPEDFKFQFSRYAGCSCPCSPGIIVQDKDFRGNKAPPAVWVNIRPSPPEVAGTGLDFNQIDYAAIVEPEREPQI